MSQYKYYIINKPCDMVSQFISTEKVGLLGDLDFKFPEGTHAIGRLDSHSEGLLILTTNKKVTRLLFEGEKPHKRTYVVKVKHAVSQETIEKLKNGVTFKITDGKYYTSSPCEAEILEESGLKFESPYITNKYGIHSWLKISLTEGKFHQIRKMVWEVGHPCRRLVRVSIEDLALNDLQPGCVREIEEEDFFKSLKIENWR